MGKAGTGCRRAGDTVLLITCSPGGRVTRSRGRKSRRPALLPGKRGPSQHAKGPERREHPRQGDWSRGDPTFDLLLAFVRGQEASHRSPLRGRGRGRGRSPASVRWSSQQTRPPEQDRSSPRPGLSADLWDVPCGLRLRGH